MRAGSLDRRVTIQSATTTQDASGQPIETWATLAVVWAGRRDVRGSERFGAQQDFATRTATYRMYWLSGIHERMRLVDAGTTYRITGIAASRRQNWLELSVEALNPEAVA